MFDILLAFVHRQQIPLIKIYNKESKEKEGIMAIIEEKRSADVRFFEPDKMPYEDLKTEYKEKKQWFETTKAEQLVLKDKWIINLPPISDEAIAKAEIENFAVWYLILDDMHSQTFFVGIPQQIDGGVQYVLTAETDQLTVAKHHWRDETTTMGQKYLRSCYEASKNPLNYMIFRSDTSFCDMIRKEDENYGQNLFKKLEEENSPILSRLNQCRKLDTIGSPITQTYGKHGRFSLESLRHLRTVHQIKLEFGRMKDWRIVEFGGGYGALCYLLSLFTNWSEYKFVEINYCLDLAKICLGDMKVKKVNLQNTDDVKDNDEEKDIDLFVSEYGFECLDEGGYDKYQWLLHKSKNAVFVSKIEYLVKMRTRLRDYFTSITVVEDNLFPNSVIFVCRDKELVV
jgi:hypothetical protein